MSSNIEISQKYNRYLNDVRSFIKSPHMSDEEKVNRILLYFSKDFDNNLSELALSEQNYCKSSMLNMLKLYGGVLKKIEDDTIHR